MLEIFKLLGTIALVGVDEANKQLEGLTGNAEKNSGKLGKAIGKMGKMATAAFFAPLMVTVPLRGLPP